MTECYEYSCVKKTLPVPVNTLYTSTSSSTLLKKKDPCLAKGWSKIRILQLQRSSFLQQEAKTNDFHFIMFYLPDDIIT